jgi:DTW domain-containing protein YfiP
MSWLKSLENDRKLDRNNDRKLDIDNNDNENDRKIDININNNENKTDSSTNEYLTIIVIDGVWRHARKMAAHLRQIIPETRHVQLTPEQFSVYARTQSQPNRICTVEALALFLSNFGEDKNTCNSLIDLVKLNNSNLKRKK